MPCGHRLRPGPGWVEPFERHAAAIAFPATTADWREERVRAAPVVRWPEHLPRPWMCNVGGGHQRPIGWFVAGVEEFLVRVADQLSGTPPRGGRARHLVAVPVVGTGAGGARRSTGDVVRELFPLLLRVARERGLDVALVTNEEATYAAAQAQRAREPDAWHALSREREREAERLADVGRSGQLVLFLGAGVSMGAGLPSWDGLLAELAAEAGLDDDERRALARLGPLDQARIVELRLAQGDERARPLGAAVARLLERHEGYALAHGLLAALPVREIVTTNYDALFERASRAIGREVSVLPHAPSQASRWLLKLHGCVSDPDRIVLTREDYLRYDQRRQALAAIVQALLITRHMLFVGFSLKDDNFHRIADAVRRARIPSSEAEATAERFGTVVDLFKDPLAVTLWQKDVAWVAMDRGAPPDGADRDAGRRTAEAARTLEIFLDRVGARTAGATEHLLDPRYDGALTDAERELVALLRPLARAGERRSEADAPAWRHVAWLLERLGHRPR